MTFAYYERLSRAQQAIYRKSDAITELRLPRPDELHPLIADLERALQSEDRAATQVATERLIHGLTQALEIPPVRVEVLAARPHAQWGELHGLYTSGPRQKPKIQLWMRTAKQRRVVAFRTYLRTLLHEVGHHVDFTRLALADSLHTEGFYKRESSLFRQLVPDTRPARGAPDYAALSMPEKVERLADTPRRLAVLLRGRPDAALSRRPEPDAWSAKEIVAHLRDADEQLAYWIDLILANDASPPLVRSAPDPIAEERQYRRQHAGEAWNAFSRRRDDVAARLRRLDGTKWSRAGRDAQRGPVTIADLVMSFLRHDDEHLDQIARALEGRP